MRTPLIASLALWLALPAHAQPAPADGGDAAPRLHANLSLSLLSDSRERGLSNSANRPSAKAALELLHASGLFAELELLRVSKAQYPGGSGLRTQLAGGYRWGDPDTWHYELTLLHTRFPGSAQTGLADYREVLDPVSGEVVDLEPVLTRVKPTTTELQARLSYDQFSLRYYQTLSRDFYGINSETICAALEDPLLSYECLQQGPQHSRGSVYLELAYRYRVGKAGSLEARVGRQRVRHFREFDTTSFSLEYRHLWRGFEFSAALVGARPRERELYRVNVGDGRSRDSARTTLVLGLARGF